MHITFTFVISNNVAVNKPLKYEIFSIISIYSFLFFPFLSVGGLWSSMRCTGTWWSCVLLWCESRTLVSCHLITQNKSIGFRGAEERHCMCCCLTVTHLSQSLQLYKQHTMHYPKPPQNKTRAGCLSNLSVTIGGTPSCLNLKTREKLIERKTIKETYK